MLTRYTPGSAASVRRLRLMAALPWDEEAVSQAEALEKSSLKRTEPMPGLISGVAVWVGRANSVGVADGGNQTMVGEGCGVSEGRGVSVGGITSVGRHALRRRNPMKSKEGIKRRME